MPGTAHGVIEGVVRRGSGGPVAGAAVAIEGDSPPHRDIAATTDDRGRFRLPGLVPGRYTLRATAEDGRSAVTSTTVAADGAAAVEIDMGPAREGSA